jgi:hypothetical protein
MVITISVMFLFTYPNLSLFIHGVITVLYDLQIFPCPTNGDATRVHRVATPSTTALRPLVQKLPSTWSTPHAKSMTSTSSAPTPTRPKLRYVADFPSKTCEGVLQVSSRSKYSLWFTSEGDADSRISVTSGPCCWDFGPTPLSPGLLRGRYADHQLTTAWAPSFWNNDAIASGHRWMPAPSYLCSSLGFVWLTREPIHVWGKHMQELGGSSTHHLIHVNFKLGVM